MIRKMTEADVREVAAIEAASFSEPWSEKSLRETLEKEEYLYLVAEEAGEIAGYVGLHMVFDEGEITTVAVRDDRRDLGIGSALLGELQKEEFSQERILTLASGIEEDIKENVG